MVQCARLEHRFSILLTKVVLICLDINRLLRFFLLVCVLPYAEAVGYGDPLIAVLPSFHGIR